MADHSTIEWTQATWNVLTGCSIESPGCKNCYAMKLAGTRLRNHPTRAGLTVDSAAGPVWTGEVRFNEQWLLQPTQWGRAREIFVCAHSDLFHPAVTDAQLDRIFAVMLIAGRHTYQVLTKRTARAADYLTGLVSPAGFARLEAAARELGYTLTFEGTPILAWPFAHIWIGTSVENQHYANLRRESLYAVSRLGFLTWVSYEPALDWVNWRGWGFIRWMVSGGESGAGARPASPRWFRGARDYCQRFGIAFFHKQNGAFASVSEVEGPGEHHYFEDGITVRHVGKKAAGRLLDGREHNGFPGD